jgi:hypothetical protein
MSTHPATARRAKANQIRKLFDTVGRALSTGDVNAASHCWAVPSLVLFDDGATAISNVDQVAQLFSQAMQWYRSKGLVATRSEIERITMLSDKLAAVDVRWPAFDGSNTEKASERSHYIVQLGEDRELRIRVALTLTR